MKRLVTLILAGVAVAAGLPGGATAHDHRPPRATLVIGDVEQKGRPLHSAWMNRSSKRFCDFRIRHGLPAFPRPLEYATGDEVAIVLHKTAPPLEVTVEAWRQVDSAGRPKGASESIPSFVTPVVRSSETKAWQIRFVPPPTAPHLYLAVEAYWPDEEECSGAPDLGSQSAAWTFHLSS